MTRPAVAKWRKRNNLPPNAAPGKKSKVIDEASGLTLKDQRQAAKVQAKSKREKKEQRRLKLYHKGYCDPEIAEKEGLGVTVAAICLWRRERGLKANREPCKRGKNKGRWGNGCERLPDPDALFKLARQAGVNRPLLAVKPTKRTRNFVNKRPEWEREVMRKFGTALMDALEKKPEVSPDKESIGDFMMELWKQAGGSRGKSRQLRAAQRKVTGRKAAEHKKMDIRQEGALN